MSPILNQSLCFHSVFLTYLQTQHFGLTDLTNCDAMGSGALQKVSEASEAEITGAYAELSPEAQQSLRAALELCHAAPAAEKALPALACRAILSGEVIELPGASKDWDYVDMAMALRNHLGVKDKVIKFFVSETPIDEYQTLSEQGLDLTCEVQYSLAELNVGDPVTLEEAMPLLRAAAEALNTLNKRDIAEVKALVRPPKTVVTVLGAVACLLQEPNRSWTGMKKMMANNFLQNLLSFDKDNVPLEVLVELQWPAANSFPV